MSNLLSELVNAISGKTRTFNVGHESSGNAGPASPAAVQTNNAIIAADGARMYQQAHPGQQYHPGQNGETYPGGINPHVYASAMNTPLSPLKMFQRPASAGIPIGGGPPLRQLSLSMGPSVESMDGLQGLPTNNGFIPMQASHRVQSLQGTDNNPLNNLRLLNPQKGVQVIR